MAVLIQNLNRALFCLILTPGNKISSLGSYQKALSRCCNDPLRPPGLSECGTNEREAHSSGGVPNRRSRVNAVLTFRIFSFNKTKRNLYGNKHSNGLTVRVLSGFESPLLHRVNRSFLQTDPSSVQSPCADDLFVQCRHSYSADVRCLPFSCDDGFKYDVSLVFG
jgi:hypothetical protein